jgi:hypothetical protein
MNRLLIALAMLAWPFLSQATAEPGYQVVRQLGEIEIRQYEPYAVAEVLIDAPAGEAGNEGFRILAAYIFGKNKGERKLEMTAPVTQTPVPVPVKLEMTAPVTMTPATGGFRVQFVLPKGVSAESAPAPLDPRVQLRNVPPLKMAVIRYTGFWSDANYNEHLKLLQEALRSADLHASGQPLYSRYDPPWTLWFMRRNEIWLPLDQP